VLTELAGESGGGFQFTGQTSKGKTSTLIDPAASVWGHPDSFAKKWRTTTNGLEALCLARNHNILILDDLGQINPMDAGQAAYLIANGQGKQRMSKEAYARPLTTWKTLLLSSGEIDLSQHIESTGKKAKGGQAARLPSIPCDTGSGWYTIEKLHDCSDGAEFSRKIKGLTRQYYGVAGIAFLEKMADDYSSIQKDIKESIAAIVKGFALPANYPPEVGRVAERFALVAYAGELATEYRITGWKAGSPLAAVQRCFNDWLVQSGGSVGHDDKALFGQVSAYLQTYGGSRFPVHNIHPDDLAKVHSRSGFTRTEDGETQYLVESQAFKNELCKGFDLKYAIKTLIDKGWLIPGNDRAQQKPRVPALNKTVWAYVMTGKAIEGGDL
jgi:putative DNA primase/helicase